MRIGRADKIGVRVVRGWRYGAEMRGSEDQAQQIEIVPACGDGERAREQTPHAHRPSAWRYHAAPSASEKGCCRGAAGRKGSSAGQPWATDARFSAVPVLSAKSRPAIRVPRRTAQAFSEKQLTRK